MFRKKQLFSCHLFQGNKKIELIKEKNVKLHSKNNPTTESWIGAGASRTGIGYNYLVWKEGKIDKFYYEELLKNKNTIEQAFGEQLSWESQEDKVTSAIRYHISEGGWNVFEKRRETQLTLIEKMQKFNQALNKHIKHLPNKLKKHTNCVLF